MKRLIVFVFAVALLGSCSESVTLIPDENFEQALIALGYDDINDGKVLTENISSIERLDLFYYGISDLSGIEAFTALTNLDCGANQLKSLDLSNNSALTYLSCDKNQLTSLDVSNNMALTHLVCWDNNLTSLDISNNTALTHISCNKNQLATLDVSKNPALTHLSCGGNKLTNLDLSNNPALTYLYCGDNQFDSKALKAKYNLNNP